MKKATAIIGSGWGDEGKGLLVDYHASKASNPLVVRYSGGANAGHTVQLPDGRRHVFAHFGAGSLCGAPTYLSEYFIVNPLLFNKELTILDVMFDVSPVVYIDASALMTTPYDMIINQLVEDRRSGARHGSCGVGINETMKRSEYAEWRMTASMLAYPNKVRSLLGDIRKYWVAKRLEELEIDLSSDEHELLYSHAIINQYITAINDMVLLADYRLTDAGIITPSHSVIFEGSQGLQLDALNSRFFPHVTHARTGMHNIRKIMSAADIPSVDVTYATRAYATRHGAGPFPQHDADMRFEDITNGANKWQGEIRFGLLDFDLIEAAIYADLMDADTSKTSWNLAMTCVDQVENVAPQFLFNQEKVSDFKSWSDIAEELTRRIGASTKIMKSYGPTRDHVISS